MRARTPDVDGYVEQDGVKAFYEVFGEDHEPTLLLMPTWPIIHSRMWKAQVPYLGRHFRVVTFDPSGNGCSDRPPTDEPWPYDSRPISKHTRARGRRIGTTGCGTGAITPSSTCSRCFPNRTRRSTLRIALCGRWRRRLRRSCSERI